MSVTPESGPQHPHVRSGVQRPQQPTQYGSYASAAHPAAPYASGQPAPGQFVPTQNPFPPQPGAQLARPTQGALAPRPATGLAMKKRNPVGAWLGLPLITLGIYGLVWYYKIHREMAEFDRRRNVPVAGPLLVLLFLSWTVIAPLISFFNTGNRIADAQRSAGLRPTCNPWIGLLLCFVFGLQVLYYQSELNKIVDAYGVPEGTEIALRG